MKSWAHQKGSHYRADERAQKAFDLSVVLLCYKANQAQVKNEKPFW